MYYHTDRDVLLLTYVDDLLYDGAEDDISYCDHRLEDRFDCKDTEWHGMAGTKHGALGLPGYEPDAEQF